MMMYHTILNPDRLSAVAKILPLARAADWLNTPAGRAMASRIAEQERLARAIFPAAFRGDAILRAAFPAFYSRMGAV